jgi:hypothetical protein
MHPFPAVFRRCRHHLTRKKGNTVPYTVKPVAVSFAALLAGCATPQLPVVPPSLAVPTSQTLALQTTATGVQIYECAAARDSRTRFEWTFKAPEAELFDGAGTRIGKHYAGPTWESNDGSKVVGEVKGRDNGPDAAAIPWLLLSATSHSGSGVFSRVQTIQRLQTSGGKAPATGCSESQAGTLARVPYKATYYFYSPPT